MACVQRTSSPLNGLIPSLTLAPSLHTSIQVSYQCLRRVDGHPYATTSSWWKQLCDDHQHRQAPPESMHLNPHCRRQIQLLVPCTLSIPFAMELNADDNFCKSASLLPVRIFSVSLFVPYTKLVWLTCALFLDGPMATSLA